MEKSNNKRLSINREFSLQVIFIALVAIVIVFLFLNLRVIMHIINRVVEILTPIIVGWVLAYIFAPLYNLVYNKLKVKHKKAFSTAACSLALLLLAVGLMFLLIPQLYKSILNFTSHANEYSQSIQAFLLDISKNSGNDAISNLLDNMTKAIENAFSIENLNFSKIFESVYNGFYLSFKAVLNCFVGYIVMIYSLNMKDSMMVYLRKINRALFPKNVAIKLELEFEFANSVFSGFIIGKVLDSLIIGIICYVCCLIMGMPYTPLIAVIVGVTNIIPFFGPFIGAVPSFLLILLDQPFSFKPYLFLIFVLVLQQVDGNIIGPKILGDKTGVESIWVLVSIILFGGLFGFVGMIVAVPLWAIIQRLFDEYVLYKLKSRGYKLNPAEQKRYNHYNQKIEK